MRRRQMLSLTALAAGTVLLRPLADAAGSSPAPILDAHIHLFDPTRPGGVPWPDPADKALYQPALPERYQRLARPHGIVGAIAIEASPLAADNDWLLELAGRSPFIVGVVGNLDPAAAEFRARLDRLHGNPLFLGIRYGNLWGRDLAADLGRPGFLEGLKAVAEAGLVFESANPNPPLVRALATIAEAIPSLRIVADHLPNAQVPAGAQAERLWREDLARLAQAPNVSIKLSEIPVLAEGRLVRDPAFYRARLDPLWELFSSARVLFGSDWPNSDHVAPFAPTLAIVQRYLGEKTAAQAHAYWFANARRVYRWRPRTGPQRSASAYDPEPAPEANPLK